ncbi:MAG: PD40 domain-containing protein [Flavobacteriales bacterium]|nr:PD40 domain-containing protein [Flavobacteriales bacterium]
MKQIFLILIWIVCTPVAFAQKGYKKVHYNMLDEARMLLTSGDHVEASKIYRKLLPVDTTFTEVTYDLAMCYLSMPEQRDKANELLERAVRTGHLEAKLELAGVRHRQQRSAEAIALYESYKADRGRTVSDSEVDRRMAMCHVAVELTASPLDLRIRNLGPQINSKAHDYSPVVNADGNSLYFTSRRDGSTGGMRDLSGQAFEDIYATRRMDEVWSTATSAGVLLNTTMHDATVGLSADGNRMIIFRTAPGMVSGDLFETERVNGVWQQPVRMPDQINSPSHEPSACYSPDGNEIYFSSDRSGGSGGRDLYRIRRLPNGQWSQPLNMGARINTPYDEDAPFMHSDGITLFFSSNGHRTMGGYDIFKSVLIDADLNGWSAPENMGHPLNTVNDDIYFCLSADGTTGYFSSERSGGIGAQDIYEVIFPDSQTDHVLVRGLVSDRMDEPVRARLTLYDEQRSEIVGVYNSHPRSGRFVMVLPPGARFVYDIEANGYERAAGQLEVLTGAGTEMSLDISVVRNDRTARTNPLE